MSTFIAKRPMRLPVRAPVVDVTPRYHSSFTYGLRLDIRAHTFPAQGGQLDRGDPPIGVRW